MRISTEDWGVSEHEHLRVTGLFHLKDHHLEIKKTVCDRVIITK